MSLLSLFDQFNASFLSFTKTLMANVELQRFLSNQMLSNVLSLEKDGQTLYAFIRLHAASKLTVLVRNTSTEVFHRAVKVKPLLQKALHSISISTVRYMCCLYVLTYAPVIYFTSTQLSFQRDRITSFRKQGMKKEKPLIQHPTDPISTQTELPVPQPFFDERSMNLSEKEIVDLLEKMMVSLFSICTGICTVLQALYDLRHPFSLIQAWSSC